MASIKKLQEGPLATNTNLYDPTTAQQYTPGTALPGSNLLQSLLTPGGLNASTGLTPGWAPQIGHITTTAATSRKRKTNPLLAESPGALKRKNPFLASQTPSADLFGLNIPV